MGSILFSHNDLDGVGCGIVAKAAHGVHLETHYCGYHNVDDKINERLDDLQGSFPTIYVTDLGIKPETAERLEKYGGEVVWLDHHATNIELASKYDWANIDTEASGTLLLFDYLVEDHSIEKYRDFAIRVDDYDRWVHNYPDSKELNRLFFILGIERFEQRCLNANNPIEFNATDKLLLELEDEKIDRFVDRVEKGITIYRLSNEGKFGVGFADRYQSEVAHELIQRLELDGIALIDVHYKKISFRSRNGFDVGSIAKRLGGGGHPQAAGVGFDYKTIEDFHGSKYPLLGVFNGLKDMVFNVFWKFNRTHEAIETETIEKLFNESNGNGS